MNKMFQFDIGVPPDGINFSQGKFSGQYYPFEAHFGQYVYSGCVVYCHLGGGVKGQGGEVPRDASKGHEGLGGLGTVSLI